MFNEEKIKSFSTTDMRIYNYIYGSTAFNSLI